MNATTEGTNGVTTTIENRHADSLGALDAQGTRFRNRAFADPDHSTPYGFIASSMIFCTTGFGWKCLSNNSG